MSEEKPNAIVIVPAVVTESSGGNGAPKVGETIGLAFPAVIHEVTGSSSGRKSFAINGFRDDSKPRELPPVKPARTTAEMFPWLKLPGKDYSVN